MKVFGGLTIVALWLFVVFIGPAFSIMALNALFGLSIKLGLGTWFAMAWVHIVLFSAKTSKS